MVAEYGLTQFLWNIVVMFKRPSQSGEIIVSIDLTNVCETLKLKTHLQTISKFNAFPQAQWLNIVTCGLALVSAVLSIKAILEAYMCYRRTEKRFNLV